MNIHILVYIWVWTYLFTFIFLVAELLGYIVGVCLTI